MQSNLVGGVLVVFVIRTEGYQLARKWSSQLIVLGSIVIVLGADSVKLSSRSRFLNNPFLGKKSWVRLFSMTMRGSLTVIVGRFE